MSENQLQNGGWVSTGRLGWRVDFIVSWSQGQRNNMQLFLRGWQYTREVHVDLAFVYSSNMP